MGAHISARVRLVREEPQDCPPVRDLDVSPGPLGAPSPSLTVLRYEDTPSESPPDRRGSAEHGAAPKQHRDAAMLSEIIKQRIRVRTSERIRDLEVHCEHGRIVIRGRCATFYTKQLAQHAAMGVVEDETLVNEVAVGLA